ncbi:MAG: hypothetical protein K2W95_35260 [Candidatus Obscuribacterales bacterium]|nr:hypothetical protein [Candidatus Obscuribacterales bacterium]
MDEFAISRSKSEEETTSNSSVYRKHRRRLLGCSICPPNRNENANRCPRTDIHKDRRKGKLNRKAV